MTELVRRMSYDLTLPQGDISGVSSGLDEKDMGFRADREQSFENRSLIMPRHHGSYDFVAINVPSTFQQGSIPDGEESPHGLLRIVTAANRLHETRPEYPQVNAGILDAHRLRLQPNEISEQLLASGVKVVGLNPTSVNVPETQEIAAQCNALGIPYILGGVHATLDPSIARSDFPEARAIIRGTGELVIGPVIKAIIDNETPSLRGVYWPETDHKTGLRAPSIDLNNLPLVEQNLLVDSPLYIHDVCVKGLKRTVHEADIFATYGCPFDCTFCSSPVLVGRGERNGIPPYRRPKMSRLVDDVGHAVNDLGADAIHFLDDMAFVTGAHIMEFHDELNQRELLGKFIWRGMTRASVVNGFDEAAMRTMRDTGAWKIALGVESGSDEVLKNIRKKVTTDEIREAVDRLAAVGIQTKGFFIMGFPGETLEQMRQTRSFVQELGRRGMTEASVFQFKPYPGTEAYAQIAREHPDVLTRLSYLRTAGALGVQDTKAGERVVSSPWLPDDVMIADVPSGVVRQEVAGAMHDFYGETA